MTIPAPDTVITNSHQLLALWEGLMGNDAFSKRSLWLVFLGPGGVGTGILLPIDDLPAEPSPTHLSGLADVVAGLQAEVGAESVPMLIARPGSATVTESDRQWANALTETFPSSPWPLHLAADGQVRPFAPDDLIGADASR